MTYKYQVANITTPQLADFLDSVFIKLGLPTSQNSFSELLQDRESKLPTKLNPLNKDDHHQQELNFAKALSLLPTYMGLSSSLYDYALNSSSYYRIVRIDEITNLLRQYKDLEVAQKTKELFKPSDSLRPTKATPRMQALYGFVQINELSTFKYALSAFLHAIDRSNLESSLIDRLKTYSNTAIEDSDLAKLAASFCPPLQENQKAGVLMEPFISAIVQQLLSHQLPHVWLSRNLKISQLLRIINPQTQNHEWLTLNGHLGSILQGNIHSDFGKNYRQKGILIAETTANMLKATNAREYI